MRIVAFLLFVLIAACEKAHQHADAISISGKTINEIKFLTIGEDTIHVENGIFSDTLSRNKDQYNYLKLDAWKWPRIIYLERGKRLNLNFQETAVTTGNDKLNSFLLNKDSILLPYTAKWDMKDEVFRSAWKEEFPVNMTRIDHYFEASDTPELLIAEIKQMEFMLRAHLTANFISFQERKGININRNIYDFVKEIDLHNERLGFHENNRNFQYYYFMDKVDESVLDSIYPFAAIDTIDKYVLNQDIKKMIITNVVKSGLYEESVNHDALFKIYERHIGRLSNDDRIVSIYQRIQNLKPGNIALDFGSLKSFDEQTISMADFKGKNILLSAWGTWCPYCKEELPSLKRLINTYPDKFESIAISLDKDAGKWKEYINQNNWKGTHLIDPERGSAFKTNYLISGTNIYYLIDKNGKIIAANVKPSSPELAALIKQLE